MADKTEFDINTFSAKLAVELLKMTGKNLVAKSLNDIQTRIVNTYKTYLTNAAKKYGQAKIFFSPNESVKFEDFYVPLSLTTVRKWQTYFIEVSTNSSVFREDNAVLLFGTAGCGKSMLMRHLFLDNLRMGSRIPILLELRDFNDSDDSLEQHLWNALRRLGFKEEISKMEKSLDMGEFTIFLDGFDEIKSSRRTNLMQEISSLIGARPNNRLIISSRYDTSIASWPNFQIFTIQRQLDKLYLK